MGRMDEVLKNYKLKKYRKCLELLKLLGESEDITENLVLENCKLICESLVKIEENDSGKIHEIQEQHFYLFEKVTSLGIITKSVPLQLKLIGTFNFIFSLLFYNDNDLTVSETEDYLELVNKGLLSGKKILHYQKFLLSFLVENFLLIVLGRQVCLVNECNIYEKIFSNLSHIKELIPNQDHKTVLSILELIVIVIVYVVKLNREKVKDCQKILNLFTEKSKHGVDSIALVDEFMKVKPISLCLFKFDLCKTASTLTDINSEVIDCLHILESVLLFLLGDFNKSLKSLQKNIPSTVNILWTYLVILNSFELENWNLCSGFLIKITSSVVQKNLKARCHIMRGKLNCAERNHKEALKEFESALKLSPNCPVVYYHIGEVYGKIGLIELMVENFNKLVEALQSEDFEDDFQPNFETTLLDWIHPVDEITEVEAYYALAVSYGLNENFKNSAETFEKILLSLDEQLSSGKRRIVDLPNSLTILHEASIMNLLQGNLVRAEQIALDAIDRYVPLPFCEKHNRETTLLCKDVEWLQKIIQQDLLEFDLEPKELSSQVFYSENLIFFFPQNVIALLILSEIQRIQEIEDYKTTLSNVFCMFSKYLASMCKKNDVDDGEKHVLTLVKALAGKTCDKIAAVQTKTEDVNVEKMFKRALSCNKGDKDALYNYCRFLLRTKRPREAFKLWNTFSKENVTVGVDSLQSFSLRYFLTDKVTKRELENLQKEIDSTSSHMSSLYKFS